MKRRIQIIIVLMLLMPFLDKVNVFSARGWTPGVERGDYFTYEMYGIYTSSHSNMTIVIPQFEKNNTDWSRIEITAVNDSMIYQIYTLHLKNGSEINFKFQTEVNPERQRSFNISEKGVPICASNLNPGDHIPTAELILNETIVRAYLSGLRETNHASWNISDDQGDIYFDRETGILVELCRTHIFTNTITGESVKKMDVIKLIDTNRWRIENQKQLVSLLFYPEFIIALISIIMATITPLFEKT